MDFSPSDARSLPPEADDPRAVICERSGRWAAALARERSLAGTRLQETRSPAECWAALARAPASFLVLELTSAGADELVERLTMLQRDFPLARAAVVADRELAPYEALVREAGAVHFTTSPRELTPLASLAERHLRQAPRAVRGLAETVWRGLPWQMGPAAVAYGKKYLRRTTA